MSEPCTRPFPQLRGHLADQRVGAFAFEEGPARHNVHATLAPREHDVGSAHASQESDLFGTDHRDDDDVVLISWFVSACQLYERLQVHSMARGGTLTLERIDVEALVVPVEIFVLKRFLECASLRVVWGDYSVGDAFILEVPSERQDRLNFFLVLKSTSRHG